MKHYFLKRYQGLPDLAGAQNGEERAGRAVSTVSEKTTSVFRSLKASPAKKGDYIEFFAETNLLGVLSVCPGGDCATEHSSDKAKCYPLKITIYSTKSDYLKEWSSPTISSYNRKHGLQK